MHPTSIISRTQDTSKRQTKSLTWKETVSTTYGNDASEQTIRNILKKRLLIDTD
jgi:hypothetical protein